MNSPRQVSTDFTLQAKQQAESVNCPVCAGTGVRNKRPLVNGYVVMGCDDCGGQFCFPFMAPPLSFYTDANDNASKSRHSGPTTWYPSHPTRQSKIFLNGHGRRLLDIGCGNGAFAEFASKAGYEVIGLDMDATSIEIANDRKLPRTKFYCQSLDEFCRTEVETGQFDVITMFEVFEHLDRPSANLRLINKLLREKGWYVGSLPNINRPLMWRIHMDYEMPPYHLTYWTTESWKKLLQQRYNFDVERCEANIYYGYISDILVDRFRSRRHISDLIGHYLYPLEFKIEKRFGLGASFYFEAKLKTSGQTHTEGS